MIIHAEVQNPNNGQRYAHAAIMDKQDNVILEVSNECKDNPVSIPYEVWINAGKVKKVKQYDFYQIAALAGKHGGLLDFFHLPKKPL